MFASLVARSVDLQRLEAEGYALTINESPLYLLVEVPYVTAAREIAYGSIASELTTAGEALDPPQTHVAYFIGARAGEMPCDQNGEPLGRLVHQSGPIDLGGSLVATFGFSEKPNPIYPDYYEKMTHYCALISGYAQEVDPKATAKLFRPVAIAGSESVFRYLDPATSRAGIGAAAEKLRDIQKLVIVGLGGTGSYILDLIAKTPVFAIHVYDADVFLTHNGFRSPGAATLDELNARPLKVDYHAARYDAIRRNIVPHPCDVTEANIDELRDADFVFVAIDGNKEKHFILDKLTEVGVPFIDVGMGLGTWNAKIGGVVRTTLGAPGRTAEIAVDIDFSGGDGGDEYENIQLADLNMLNAALAVIRFKRYINFYFDFDEELTSLYSVDGNHMLNLHSRVVAAENDEDAGGIEEAA